MRVLILGDVGGAGGYHAGDEAMAEAAIAELASRTDIEVVAISGDVADTEHRYGWDAVPRIGFEPRGSATDAERDARLASVLQAANGDASSLDWDDPAWHVIHEVARADAVLISGGGNLTSTWPEHVYERAALVMIAARLATPVVVTGQTVGPQLTERHGELAGRVLTASALVAAREARSYQTILDLGADPERVARVVDDATYLTPDPDAPVPEHPYIVGTFPGHLGALDDESLLEQCAALLEDVGKQTSSSIVLVGHHGGAETAGSDAAVHRRIAALIEGVDVSFVDCATARQIVALTRHASLVVSARYHPLVFALGAGVPCLGIASDDYTERKLTGAMDQFGLSDFVVPTAALAGYAIGPVVDELIDRQGEISEHLRVVNEIRRAEQAAWWDRVLTTLVTGPVGGQPPTLTPQRALEGGAWAPQMRALKRWCALAASRFAEQAIAAASLQEELLARAVGLDEQRRLLALTSAQLDEERDRSALLQESLDAAHTIIVEQLSPYVDWVRSRPTVEGLSRQVDRLSAEVSAIYRTKTFRTAAPLRRIYALLRRPRGGRGTVTRS